MSTIIQRAFSSGEISPALYARVDFFKYQTGLRTCRNFFIMRHGGATNRPGTKFVGEVRDSSKTVRLQEFIFNEDQTYVLEFGNLYLRFIKNGSYLKEAAKVITAITQANPGVVSVAAHGYSNGDEVFISSVSGMTQVNDRTLKVAGVTAGTFQLQEIDGTPLDTTGYDAYISGGTSARIYKITTVYPESSLSDLQFAQSADVVTIVHPLHAPSELSRVAELSWTLTGITYEPGINPPTVINSGGGPIANPVNHYYVITSISSEDYEESLASVVETRLIGEPTLIDPIQVLWGVVSGAAEYNIYKAINGIYGLMGSVGPDPASPTFASFNDIGLSPDTSRTPPIARDPFPSAGNFPSAVSYYQQRLIFANTINDPEKVWASRTALFKNFTISSPIQDDDAVTFTLAGRRVNEVRYLVDLKSLILFTSAGEWTLEGSQDGVLTPSTLNLRQQSYNGSGDLSPIVIGNSALYVQARGSIIRDLGYEFQADGYQGNDLTLFSNHLFDDYSLVDWDYQQTPHSVLWAVRSDGILLALTFIREQQLLAWSRHDFDGGFVENVCVVPEGNEDVLYVTVKRTIDGKVKRYVERMNSRNIIDIADVTFLDSHKSYDGRNTTATTMTLSGGTTWEYTETLTLTSSTSFFSADDIGNEIQFDYDEQTLRCDIISFVSPTVVNIKPQKTVPVVLRTVATTSWSRAISRVTGLWHLEGKNVSVFGDGFVAASPYNNSYDIVTVSQGTATLDKPFAVIHVGLPFTSDLESLDIDSPKSETLSDKNKQSKHVTLTVEETRGLFAGPQPPSDDSVNPLEGLEEFKIRQAENYDDPIALQTGIMEVNLTARWNDNGRIFLRQVDPLPASVLSIAAAGLYPFKGGN